MEQSIHTTSKGKLRKNSNKNKADKKIVIIAASYLKDFEILLYLNNGEQIITNFLTLFSKLSGAYAKYNQLNNFKKFIVKNGNIFWGENEDVIFPVSDLHRAKFSKKPKDEILYIL